MPLRSSDLGKLEDLGKLFANLAMQPKFWIPASEITASPITSPHAAKILNKSYHATKIQAARFRELGKDTK